MKFKTLTSFLGTLLLLLASAHVVGQQTDAAQGQKKLPLRYKLIDLGTLGGPNSSEGPRFPIVNSRGVVAGASDTLLTDPNCVFPPNCLDLHATQWDRGTLRDLGTLPGGNNSDANAINSHGQIAGLSENGLFDSFLDSPVTRPVLWRNGQIVGLGDFGGPNGFANGTNNRGQVVGAVQNDIPDPLFGTQAQPFLWQNGVLRNLGTLGGPNAFADFVNESGQVTGFSSVNLTPYDCYGFPAVTHAFFWERGKMQDLGTLGGTCSIDRALNNRGQVAGFSDLAGDQSAHPFLWGHGTMIDLGTLGGSSGFVFAMNEAGHVVGNSYLAGDEVRHAVLWRNGKIIDLGTIGDDPCSDAHGMNIRDETVGSSDDCVEQELHGFLWQPGGPMIDLNVFVPPDSDLTITDGHTINDRGEITASGMLLNGDFHAVLLIPCGPDGTSGCHEFSGAETRITRSLPAAPHRDSFNSMRLLGSRGWSGNRWFGTIPRTSSQ